MNVAPQKKQSAPTTLLPVGAASVQSVRKDDFLSDQVELLTRMRSLESL